MRNFYRKLLLLVTMLMAVTSVSAQHGVSIDMGESYLENNTHMTHEVVGLNSMTNTLKGKHANVLKNDTTLSRRERMRSRIDSVLTTRYYNTPYDTNYVVRPEGTLTLKLRWNEPYRKHLSCKGYRQRRLCES